MKISNIIFIVVGIIVAIYGIIYVMMYGGIMQIINNWGTDTSLVVWGIIRVVFSELGAIPGAALIWLGLTKKI